ncbi:MAG: molybdate ABC transporter permease subunit [Longimicrobiales bacterium]
MVSALRLSVQVTLVATLVAALLGLLLGRLLARREFAGKSLVETVVLLPLVLPPSVVGYYLLIGLGERNPVFAWLDASLLFTWQGAAFASAVVGLPLMVQASKAAIASVNPAFENAARVLGAGETEVFLRITLPLARRGIIAGIVLAGARAFGEFGATLMVAGSIPGRTQTVPLAIYDAVQAGRYSDANQLVILTTILAFTSLLVVRGLERPRRPRRAGSDGEPMERAAGGSA